MPLYLHEFIDDDQDFYQVFLIDFSITLRGVPGTYFDPPEPAEFEIDEIIRLAPVPPRELEFIKKLRYSERPVTYVFSGHTYYEGPPLTAHQQEIIARRMKKDWSDIVNENWDPEWEDNDYYD